MRVRDVVKALQKYEQQKVALEEAQNDLKLYRTNKELYHAMIATEIKAMTKLLDSQIVDL